MKDKFLGHDRKLFDLYHVYTNEASKYTKQYL